MPINAPNNAPIDRVDARVKVTGAAKFAADHTPAGVAYGYLVTSTIARGTVKSADTRAAARADGVIAVYTPDAPLRLLPPVSPVIQVIGEARRPLQDHDVHYYGQIVGLVVAETFEQARDAAALVKIGYAAETPRASFADAVPGAALPPPPFGQPITVLADGVTSIEDALERSEVVFTATYRQPPQQHNPMEPHAAVAQWEGDRLTVYSSTQGPALHALEIGEAFGVPPSQVHVISPHVGGAFGGKATTWAPTLLAAGAARALGRPVKVVTTREQLYTVTGHRTEFHQQVSLGAGRDGTLTALDHDSVSNLVMENPSTPSVSFYRVPNLRLRLRVAEMDVPKATIMRAPGFQPGSFALESAMDELAIKLGMDPIDLRMKNYLTVAPDTKLPYSSKHLDECYRVGASRFGWVRRRSAPRSVTDGDWLVGTGMATGVLHASWLLAAARVRFRANGTAQVSTANSDLGTGAWTVLTLVGAERLGLPADRIRPGLGDSTLATNPDDLDSMMGAVSSSTTATMGNAVSGAAADAIEALVAHAVAHPASPFHGLDPAQVRYSKGDLIAKGKTLPFGRLLTMTGTDGVEAVHIPVRGQAAYAFASYAAYFCEMRVNRFTGEPRLSRLTAVVDAGTVVSPKTAHNQLVGAIVMSVGQALVEEAQLEAATGRIANANLADYLVPVNADIKNVDVHFLDHPDTNFAAAGARGLGELGCVGAAAAIANAVHDATGVRVRDLPITPEKLLP